MIKQYLPVFLFSALVLGAFSPVLAQEGSVDASVETGNIQLETRARVNTDLRSTYEAGKAALEAQRERIKAETEARKAAAEARGDEAQARREALRVELEARRAEADARRETARAEAEARRAEAQARRVEFQRAAAERRVENAARVILATIERLEKIINRIESRIAKIQARGGATSEAEASVALAKGNLADARASVNAFINIDLSSEIAQDNFEKVRAAAAEAREHLRAAHRNLMMAVRSLSAVEASTEVNSSAEL